jgi:HTH-type transcriptional regulator/antitoxin HigA
MAPKLPKIKSRTRQVKITAVKKESAKKNVRKKQIRSKEAYDLTMQEIDALMKKGEKNLTDKERMRLRTLAEAAEWYEDTHEPMPVPSSLPEMIHIRMIQMRLNQGFTAKLLGISDAKFSLIMNGKQKPDIYFIKAIHDKLGLDGNLLLKAI